MISDTIKLAVGGGVTLTTAVLALRAGLPRPANGSSPQRAPSPSPATPASISAPATPARLPGGRPRILTGEPAPPEQRKPVPMRALKLIIGITVLAVAGASLLIAAVRALIALFDRLTG